MAGFENINSLQRLFFRYKADDHILATALHTAAYEALMNTNYKFKTLPAVIKQLNGNTSKRIKEAMDNESSKNSIRTEHKESQRSQTEHQSNTVSKCVATSPSEKKGDTDATEQSAEEKLTLKNETEKNEGKKGQPSKDQQVNTITNPKVEEVTSSLKSQVELEHSSMKQNSEDCKGTEMVSPAKPEKQSGRGEETEKCETDKSKNNDVPMHGAKNKVIGISKDQVLTKESPQHNKATIVTSKVSVVANEVPMDGVRTTDKSKKSKADAVTIEKSSDKDIRKGDSKDSAVINDKTKDEIKKSKDNITSETKNLISENRSANENVGLETMSADKVAPQEGSTSTEIPNVMDESKLLHDKKMDDKPKRSRNGQYLRFSPGDITSPACPVKQLASQRKVHSDY